MMTTFLATAVAVVLAGVALLMTVGLAPFATGRGRRGEESAA